jgi:tRNA1(Val) A37 N6-methylase TrmN6
MLVLFLLQVNSAGAEKLYSLAGDWAGLGPDTLLFDVCCGTGAIGLTLAKRVGMVCYSFLRLTKLNGELCSQQRCTLSQLFLWMNHWHC